MNTTYRQNRSVSVASPAKEPLTLTEAKQHLGVAQNDAAHDVHIRDLIVAGRQQWEHDTQRLTSTRKVTENLEDWPDYLWRFYYRPISSITSIQYYDSANAQQTLSTDVYELDAPNQMIRLKVDQEYPAIETRWDAITVVYSAGQTTTDEIVKHAMKLLVDIGFEMRGLGENRDPYIKAYDMLALRYQRASYP